jgi:microsomal epoxide hydrolase
MPPNANAIEGLSTVEKEGWDRCLDFYNLGSAYSREHGTRPSTIGLVLSASPISLLAW